MKVRFYIAVLLVVFLFSNTLTAQIPVAPNRNAGDGPYTQLIIRGVTVINGTGAPALGPVDIVIENNRIVKMVTVGSEGSSINQQEDPSLQPMEKRLMQLACLPFQDLLICIHILVE